MNNLEKKLRITIVMSFVLYYKILKLWNKGYILKILVISLNGGELSIDNIYQQYDMLKDKRSRHHLNRKIKRLCIASQHRWF